MARALASACIVLAICLGGSAWAKPKIAILGLEAAPGPSGTVDPATTQVARAITKELRLRAQAVGSPYAMAPNSSKELSDEKLLMSCDSEAAACMVVIGAGLAADVLLYGRVEKKGELYRVSLKRLDVKAKTIEEGGEELPVGSGVNGMAKRLYVKLIGESAVAGTLIVKAASQTGAPISAGTVMIDEEPRGKLAEGRATIAAIPEGRHVLAIEAGGYQRFEETVTIHSGEPATLNALLLVRPPKDAPAPDAGGGHAGLWKASLGASVVVAVVGGSFAGYAAYQVYKEGVLFNPAPGFSAEQAKKVTNDDCGQKREQIEANKHSVVSNQAVFDRACDWTPRLTYGLVVTSVGVVGIAISAVMLSRSREPSERPRTGTRRKATDVALVPIVTPSLAGASLSLRW